MKVAGIDVHKKVLMVVVVDASNAGRERAAAIRHHAERVTPLADMVARAGSRRGGDGIDGAVLADGESERGARRSGYVRAEVSVNESFWPAGMAAGSERPPKLKTELFELAAARRLLLTSVK